MDVIVVIFKISEIKQFLLVIGSVTTSRPTSGPEVPGAATQQQMMQSMQTMAAKPAKQKNVLGLDFEIPDELS